MEIDDFKNGSIWPIMPGSLELLYRDVSRIQKNETPESMADKIAAYQESKNKSDLYQVRQGVAIIPIVGPISKRMTFYSWLMGGTSYSAIEMKFNAAIRDNDVRAIVLDIDSPGGVANGVRPTTDLIFVNRERKPIVAYANGRMASAAYWVGSSANMVIGDALAEIGSIGVLMVHADWSGWNEKAGINFTYLAAGKYKALGNPDEPLSDLAKKTFQKELEYYYSIFIEDVARNRGRNPETVSRKMADGKVFIGEQARSVGLVDEIGTLQTAIDAALELATAPKTNTKRSQKMEIKTAKELSDEYPDLVKNIRDEAVAGLDVDGKIASARSDEQAKILDLVKIQFGDEKGEKFAALVKTGITSEQMRAIVDIQAKEKIDAEKKASETEAKEESSDVKMLKTKLLGKMIADQPENPGFDSGSKSGLSKDYLSLVDEYMQTKKCSRFDAMAAINKSHPDARRDFIQSKN